MSAAGEATYPEKIAARFSWIERQLNVITLMLAATLALEVATLLVACR